VPTEKAKRVRAPKEPKPRIVPDDLAAVVLEALRAVSSLKSGQLKKSLPKSYQSFGEEALAMAHELVFRKELHSHAKGKTEILFARDPFATLDELSSLVKPAPITSVRTSKKQASRSPASSVFATSTSRWSAKTRRKRRKSKKPCHCSGPKRGLQAFI
jgi:hypothetical protein